MNGDVLIDWALVSGAAVVLAFVVNQLAAWAGYEAPVNVRKGVAFVVALGLSTYFALQGDFGLPDYTVDPVEFLFALGGVSTLIYKASQEVYDHIWQGLVAA